jgi:hypothetical protein
MVILKLIFIYEKETASKELEEIYSSGKSPHKKGGFRVKKPGEANSRAL